MANLSEAIGEFSKKFARFAKTGQELPQRKTADDFLQEKINAGEAGRKQALSRSYRLYKDPFGVLGTTSDRARAIYDDEQALLKAYNLFKSVSEAISVNADKETFVSAFEISSPLAKKNSYTFGGQFIFLTCWLMFEAGISDFTPLLEERNNAYYLTFVSAKNHTFDSADAEAVRLIREIFY